MLGVPSGNRRRVRRFDRRSRAAPPSRAGMFEPDSRLPNGPTDEEHISWTTRRRVPGNDSEVAAILARLPDAGSAFRLRRRAGAPPVHRNPDSPRGRDLPGRGSARESRPRWRHAYEASHRRADRGPPEHDGRGASGALRRGLWRADPIAPQGPAPQAHRLADPGKRGGRTLGTGPAPCGGAGQQSDLRMLAPRNRLPAWRSGRT
jgi:hypothetical protein